MEKLYGSWKVILLVLMLGCSEGPYVYFDTNPPTPFYVTVADNDEVRMQGLMFVENMPEDEGMLFVFEDNKPRRFWMMNTLISLDMIFLDENLTVVNITHGAVPCKEEPCERYHSGSPAKYVLEVNGGIAKEKNIEIGNKLTLRE